MAMAAAGCTSMIMLPLKLKHRNHCRALHAQQRIKSRSYHRHERPFNTSFDALHHKTMNARCKCKRAVPEGDGDREKCNTECKDEKPSIDAPLCAEEITEMKGIASPEQPEPVKEQEQQQSCVGKVKPGSTRGRFDYFSKLGFCKARATSRDEELKHQHNPTQDLRCRLRSWWHHATWPQNLLAAFFTGLLLYAFALFGWQVMVVAVDVTLFVLKCSFVAIVLLFMYIFLI